jgi:hypothetical protein
MTRFVICAAVTVYVFSAAALASNDNPARASLEVVERYAELRNEGPWRELSELFTPGAVLMKHDLTWHVWRDHALHERLRIAIVAEAHVHADVLWTSEDGAIVVTRERLTIARGATDDPDAVNATVTYVIDGGRLASVAWVRVANERDELRRDTIVGTWASAQYRMRIAPDGPIRVALHLEDLDDAPLDSATWSIRDGVLSMVSDDATTICRPGDSANWHVRFTSRDAFELVLINETCPHGRRGRHVGYTRVWTRFSN